MEICLQMMPSDGFETTMEVVSWAEDRGVPALAVADHWLAGPDLTGPAPDQIVQLAAIAARTSTIGLSTLVSPISLRHPASLLKAAVTLDDISGGRFTLGVGAGWMQAEHDAFGLVLWDMTERFDRLEDALGYLRAGFDTDRGYDGDWYRLEPFQPQPKAHNLRLVVGGAGPERTPDLAGRFADEFNVFPSKHPRGERISRFRASAVTARRDPDSLGVSLAFPPMVSDDNDEVDERLAANADRFKSDVETLRREFEELDIPIGSTERAADFLEKIRSEGITRVYLQLGNATIETAERALAPFERAAAQSV